MSYDSIIVKASILNKSVIPNLNLGTPEIITMDSILRNVCNQWEKFTYNSHIIYLRLFLLTIFFRFLDKKFPIILFKKSKFKDFFPKYKPKSKFMKWFMGLYWSREDSTLFWEIQDFFHRLLLFRILYTILTQFIYVEQLSIVQIAFKILGV